MESVVSEDGSHDLRSGGRWAQWWASWRVAVRMARRDVRRHKGRSTLIALMVGLPVLALVAGAVVLTTGHLDDKEELPFRLGDAAAAIHFKPGNAQIFQSPTNSSGMGYSSSDVPALPLPPAATTAESLSRLTKGRLVELVSTRMTVKLRRWQTVGYLGVDSSDLVGVGQRVSLVSGRWPRSADEVLVTEAGVGKGLPRAGSLAMKAGLGDGPERTVKVVGVGKGYLRNYSTLHTADLIGLPTPPDTEDPMGFAEQRDEYLLFRDTPVTWADVQAWNRHGLYVLSRAVLNDPPTGVATAVGPGLAHRVSQDVTWAGIAALVGVGLTLLTSLLAGPAFAVSAARQRRTLALAACNGAARPQLRRTVLGQAMVLGLGSSIVALALGIGLAWLVVAYQRPRNPDSFIGPFDIAWAPVSVVVTAAVLSSVISALVPSRGLGKLDIVAVLRGQNVSPRLRKRSPVAGLVLAAAGSALTLRAATTGDSPNVMATGAVLLVTGALLIVPLILTVWSWITADAPAALRMATRDAARQRGWATPTVAAILAGAAALSAALVFIASDTARQGQRYVSRTPDGQGVVTTLDPSGEVAAAITRAAPGVRVSSLLRLADILPSGNATDITSLWAMRSTCSAEQQAGADPTIYDDPTSGPFCDSLNANAFVRFSRVVAAADPMVLATRLRLDADERAFLASGGMLVVGGSGERPREIWGDGMSSSYDSGSAQVDIVDGHVIFKRSVVEQGDGPPRLVSLREAARVPARALDRTRFTEAFPRRDVGAVTTTETLRRIGQVSFDGLALQAPDRAITTQEQEAMRDAVERAGLEAEVHVERGFQREDLILVLAVIGLAGFIMLVATLIATALSQAEAQSMSSTLAAVGATRLTRRNIAAAQAGSLAAIGATLGVLIGLVPGIALVRHSAVGRAQWAADGLPLVVPWMQLLVPVVVIPLIAAALAWVSIRKHPTVTRRLT